MERIQPTTPFGRRPLSLAMVAAQETAKACPENAAAEKWRVLRNLTEAKDRFGLSDRAIAVLNALLTFHPDTALTPGPDLVVFPSNATLALRCHGPAPATLRRALAQLVEAGVVIRRDSPNGKRYTRRGEGGQVAEAFGFDLTPLVTRAAEFEQVAEEVRAEARARTRLREEISLHRRDIAKTISAGLEEDWQGPWADLADRLVATGGMPARAASRSQLQAIADALRELRTIVAKSLVEHMETQNSTGNESQPERHYQNSNTDHSESEPAFRESRARAAEPASETTRPPSTAFPLGMVLRSCPDIADYARGGISNWRDLVETAGLVRSVLGISPSAWADACEAMGEGNAAVVVAAILQRADAIRSPSGYLRSLTEKARAGQFSTGPVLMALWRSRVREPARA